MKNIKSYVVLDDLKNDLLKNGFTNLPENATDADIFPFQEVYEHYYPELSTALIDDLTIIDITDIEFVQHSFEPENQNAQGATICYIYTKIGFDDNIVEVAFKYFVFQNIIHCYWIGDISEATANQFRNSDNNFMKSLAESYQSGRVNHLYTFF